MFYWTPDPPGSMRATLEAVSRAGSNGWSDAWTLAALGSCRLLRRDHDAAVTLLRLAVAVDPNSSLAQGALALALALILSGHPEEALAEAAHADRLSPLDRRAALWANARGIAGMLLNNPALALEAGRFIARQHPDHPAGQRQIAAGAAMLGEAHLAVDAVARIKAVPPDQRVSAAIAALPFRHAADARRCGAALEAAGLPP